MELRKCYGRDELNIKIAKWEESSKSLNILLNSQMSFHDKNGLRYGTKLNEMSDKSETDSEISMSVFKVRSSDEESTPVNDDFPKEMSETVGNTNEVNVEKPKPVNESVVSTPNVNKDKVIIEDWNSDDEDDVSEVSLVKTNETQTAKTQGNPEICLQDHVVVDSGCSSHMTGNKAYLSDYVKFYMEALWPFGNELKFNLFSVSQMCDKKNSVLFTDTECLILSPSFKLLDENQVVLRAPRHNGVYSLDLKNIVPSGDPFYVLLCAKKGIKREFSVAITPQQNGVAERKNRTLIEAARTMLADSLLPIPFWAEAVNTTCYVLNRVLVTKPQNKTPYETIYSGTQESYVAGSSGKDKEPTQEYILLPLHPYRPRILVEDDDATRQAFEEEKRKSTSTKRAAQATSINKLNTGRPSINTANTSFLIALLVSYTDANAGESLLVYLEADFNNMDNTIDVSPIPTLRVHKDHPKGQILGDPKSAVQTRGKIQKASSVQQALKVWILVDLLFGKKAIGIKWVFRNKRDERSIVLKNKARLVAQGFRHEEGIEYDEVFAPVARIEAIRLFLAFASFMGFPVYQMDVKSAFLYGTIEEKVYVHQPLGFVDPAHPNKVYKVIKALMVYIKLLELGMRHFLHSCWKMVLGELLTLSELSLISPGQDEDGVDVDVHIYRTSTLEFDNHFIRDCYEKRLIDVVKIHTDNNVADLLTKGFDVTRFNFLVLDINTARILIIVVTDI
ncbi:retrovirus-related pol polyprotein from transposon TNT 1-94 [Tanacetum coccineum]